MTFDQITTLLDRGFTPDQITLLTTSGTPTMPDSGEAEEGTSFHPQEEPPASPLSPAAAPDPDPEPEPAPAPVPETSNTEILEAIADLKASVQKNNIRTMSMGTVSSENELEKAMAEIIRPRYEKGE